MQNVPDKPGAAPAGGITLYSLSLRHKDEQSLYVWQYHPPAGAGCRCALLIDLGAIYLPKAEIARLAYSLDASKDSVCAIAFANCNAHNQRELKRRLKEQDVRLFSCTSFFPSLDEAELWLRAQSASH